MRHFTRCATVTAGFVLSFVTVMPADAQVRAELVAEGFSQAVAYVQHPSDSTIQFVVQQDGRIRAIKSGVVQATDFLDLRGVVRNSGEQGLLGLALTPNYATSRRFFVNFVNADGHTVIARFTRAADDELRADPGSRFDLRWPDGLRVIEQPFTNHKGGNLAFGPDGFLYIGMGDGGSGNDPGHRAQNPQTLLGKMLRLNVAVSDSDPEGYDIPSSNPFAGQAGVLREIWSFGLRNPWRWSFDNPARGGTGALVIGDVGQSAWEEVNYEPAGRGGRNYGWRNREGAHDNVTSLPPFSTPLVDPIFEYSPTLGRSIVGGVVYRGTSLGLSFRGRYFFADFVSGRVFSLRLTVNTSGEATASDLIQHTEELGAAAASPSSFGVDNAGEIYIVNYAGRVHRLVGTGDPAPGGGGSNSTGQARPMPPGSVVVGRAIPREGHSSFAGGNIQLAIERSIAPDGMGMCEAIIQLTSDEEPIPLEQILELMEDCERILVTLVNVRPHLH